MPPDPPGPAHTAPPDSPTCLVCQYQPGAACHIPYLRGRLAAVDLQAGPGAPGGRLQLQLDDGSPCTLLLQDSRWLALLPLAHRALAQAAAEPGEGEHIEVAAYHLSPAGPGRLDCGPHGIVVLEPDWLINVTDLTQLEYCPRTYLVDRFKLPDPNLNLVRGNIVHQAFEQMLKTPDDDSAINQALGQAVREQARDLAALGLTKRMVWNEISRHYHRLKDWARSGSRPGRPRTESFLLAPQVGLKGKLDALWTQAGRAPLVVELKTGRSMGAYPKPGHAFQAGAYSLMTIARGWAQPSEQRVLVLYSGNQELAASPNIERRVPLNIAGVQDAVHHRNQLVLADYLSDAAYETHNLNKCFNCSIRSDCALVGYLFEHRDPRPPQVLGLFAPAVEHSPLEKAWFSRYARLLFREFRAIKQQHAALWRRPAEQRLLEGMAFAPSHARCLTPDPGPYLYALEGDNQSELREEDFVLVSDALGPTRGVIAQGTVKHAAEDGLQVQFSEPLEFEPRLVDPFVTETLVERLFAGLYRWLELPPAYRDLVLTGRLPEFNSPPEAPLHPPQVGLRRLNDRQQLAVRQAINMHDCLLVLGPPGAGKTTLIAAIARELLARGQRLLLAAGTNTALDNMIKPLLDAGFGDQLLRLGAEGRADSAVKGCLPEALADDPDLDTYVSRIGQVLGTRRIVGATAATWLSSAWRVFGQFDAA
ncbi:MAG: AAA domain-containing protein, partial [Chloroflexota bacterium]